MREKNWSVNVLAAWLMVHAALPMHGRNGNTGFQPHAATSIAYPVNLFFPLVLMCAWLQGVQRHGVARGKPAHHAHVERFNGKVRDDWINTGSWT